MPWRCILDFLQGIVPELLFGSLVFGIMPALGIVSLLILRKDLLLGFLEIVIYLLAAPFDELDILVGHIELFKLEHRQLRGNAVIRCQFFDLLKGHAIIVAW